MTTGPPKFALVGIVLAGALLIPAAAAARMTAEEVAAANAKTIATLFDGLPAAPQPWNAIVFHHSATAGGSKARFDVGHRRKFDDPDGMEYHFLIGSGVGSADGLIEVGDRAHFAIAPDAMTTHRGIDGRLTQCPGKNFPLAKIKAAIASAAGATPPVPATRSRPARTAGSP